MAGTGHLGGGKEVSANEDTPVRAAVKARIYMRQRLVPT
jgi:hypothetical protein